MSKLQQLLDARWDLNSVEVNSARMRWEFEQARALFTEGYNAAMTQVPDLMAACVMTVSDLEKSFPTLFSFKKSKAARILAVLEEANK